MSINKIISILFLQLASITVCFKNDYSHKVITPADQKELEPIIAQIKANKEKLKKQGFDLDSDLDEYGYVSDFTGEDVRGYIVDINNDGKKEYVFVSNPGRLGIRYFRIFACDKSGIKYIEEPSGCCFQGTFHNPITGQEELFIEVKNKIYMCSDMRNIFIWEKGVCWNPYDDFWITNHRNLFNSLYQKKLYKRAFELLSYFEKKWRKKIPKQKDLWLKNDLALAAIKSPYYFDDAAIYLDEINNDEAFKNSSEELKRAVKTNERLYAQAREQESKSGAKGKHDFTWLLKHVNSSYWKIGFDNNMSELFAHITKDRELIRDLEMIFWHCDIIKLVENRYLVIAGSGPGSWLGYYGHHGFLVCDLKDNTSLLAKFIADDCDYDTGRKIDEMQIYTRSLLVKEFSQKYIDLFCSHYKDRHFFKNTDLEQIKITFHDNWNNSYDIKLTRYSGSFKNPWDDVLIEVTDCTCE